MDSLLSIALVSGAMRDVVHENFFHFLLPYPSQVSRLGIMCTAARGPPMWASAMRKTR